MTKLTSKIEKIENGVVHLPQIPEPERKEINLTQEKNGKTYRYVRTVLGSQKKLNYRLLLIDYLKKDKENIQISEEQFNRILNKEFNQLVS